VITENVDVTVFPSAFCRWSKAFEKIGKAEPKALVEPALQLYPLGILIGYYRELKVIAEGVDAEVGVGAIKADQLKGEITIERPSGRTISGIDNLEEPRRAFGVARWTAK